MTEVIAIAATAVGKKRAVDSAGRPTAGTSKAWKGASIIAIVNGLIAGGAGSA